MAIWWITEAAPLAATSLIPIVMFPLLGVQSVRDVTPNYANHMVFLFFGGFVLALAVEASGLHQRLALTVLDRVGSSPRRLVWGFLLVTAGLSMWLSNTATTLMLLPIAGGVVARMEDHRAKSRIFLALAYGASVGGMATLVGTPPNLVLAGMAPELLPDLPQLTFGGWMLFGLPLVMILVPILGLRLGRGLPGGRSVGETISQERSALGPMSSHEKRAAVLFLLTAVAWMTRAGFDFGAFHIRGWSDLFPSGALITDAVVAVAAAVLATLLPAGGRHGRRMISWVEIHDGVPWGILLLFGGGFALADAVRTSGLDSWLAGLLGGLAGLPLPVVLLSLCLVATFVTELTSNTATATLLMPVMAALSGVLDVPPYLLMVAATLSCSCAFMLPVATPPNAIVIGAGHVTPREMAREGLWLNLVVAVVLTVMVLTWGRVVLPV
jgi:sodium-dependent dicarboxylate transporter 2/3/5